jgi:hypothetical protein
MKHSSLLLLLFTVILLTACSSDDTSDTNSSQRLTIKVPVEVVTDHAVQFGTRAAAIGDPGYDDELPYPTNLYIWAWVQVASSRWELLFQKYEGLTATDWTYKQNTTGTEDQSSRYDLQREVTLSYESPVIGAASGVQVGRVYAVASNKALTQIQLEAISGDTYKSVITATTAQSFTTSPDATLQAATLNTAGWTSTDLRDFYSNPLGDTGTDASGILNGRVISRPSNTYHVEVGTVRLYHCAAKADFTWEVAESLRPTTWVKTITITNVPTVCTVFNPTHNAISDIATTTETITTDMGSQWIGREYRYVLQQGVGSLADLTSINGNLSYKVEFGAPATATPRSTVSTAFVPIGLNQVFTGWYRVRATVQ